MKDKKKHLEFCKKDVEERKVKGGAKARVEAGLKHLDVGMEKALKLEQPEKFKKRMEEIIKGAVRETGRARQEEE